MMKKKLFGLLLLTSTCLFSNGGGFVNNIVEGEQTQKCEDGFGITETTNDESNKLLSKEVKKTAYIGNDSTLEFSRTYVQSFKKNNVAYLRFATAVKGTFKNLKYIRTMGSDVKEVEVTTMYKGITTNNGVAYYTGTDISTDSKYSGQYLWAVYIIRFDSVNSKATDITAKLEIEETDGSKDYSEEKTTSLAKDLALTAQDLFGSDYNIGFALSSYAENDLTNSADDIYCKYSNDGTNMTFDMKGLGTFSDTEYVKIVLHNSLYNRTGWGLIGGDVTFDISKDTIYEVHSSWDLWEKTNFENNSSDKTAISETPTFTQNEGWFELKVVLPITYISVHTYANEGQIKAFFSEWDYSKKNSDGKDILYGPRSSYINYYNTYNGEATGDMANQTSYISLQSRTVANSPVAKHNDLINNSNIRNNKLTLTHNGDNGYSDVFATRDDNGIYLRIEQRVKGGKFVGNYNSDWWENDNIEFRFSNGNLDEMYSSTQRVICANPKVLQNDSVLRNAWDQIYVEDINNDGTYWNINYEMYVSYEKLGLNGVDSVNDTVLFKGGVNDKNGWCAFAQTDNILKYEDTNSSITASGLVKPEINGILNRDTSASLTTWNSNVAQIKMDGSKDWEVVWNFDDTYTAEDFNNGELRSQNWVAEVYSTNWGNGGATIRNDWCGWGAWSLTTEYGGDFELYKNMLNTHKPTQVKVTLTYSKDDQKITLDAVTTSTNIEGTVTSRVIISTGDYTGEMWVTLGGNCCELNNISAQITKGYLVA